jgi:lysophospholipase L1-like esterase
MRLRVIGAVAASLMMPVVVLAVEVQLARMGAARDAVPAGRDGCFGCVGPTPVRVTWLGDSTAAGVGASQADTVLAAQVARVLGRPMEIRNLAISGARAADVLADQLPQLGAGMPAVVAISVGANDVTHLTSAGTFQREYRELLARIPEAVTVVALGIPDMGSPPRLRQPLRAIAGARARRLDRVIRTEAARRRAIYVDIAGGTGPRFRADHALFSGDGYHPNDRGYEVWAQVVAARWPPS